MLQMRGVVNQKDLEGSMTVTLDIAFREFVVGSAQIKSVPIHDLAIFVAVVQCCLPNRVCYYGPPQDCYMYIAIV